MNAGVYEGESRAIPRWTVTVLLIQASVRFASILLAETPGARTDRDAPMLLRLPFEVRPITVVLTALAIFALVQFGRRRHPLAWGGVAMGVLLYLSRAQVALTGSDEHDLTICGALLAGWLFGILFARSVDRRLGRARDPDRDDALGEAGARGTFVAVYVGAFTSKVLEAGTHWSDGRNLLAHMVSQHQFTGGILDAYLGYVLQHPDVATLFAASALVIQAGMLLSLVGPRLQMIWAALIVGFHLNAFLLMGVKYFNPIVAVIALSYPWPRIVRRLRGGTRDRPAPIPAASDAEAAAVMSVARRAAAWMAVAGAIALIVRVGVLRP
jgi:hypothetical protein